MSDTVTTANGNGANESWLRGLIFDDILPAWIDYQSGQNPNSTLPSSAENSPQLFGPAPDGATDAGAGFLYGANVKSAMPLALMAVAGVTLYKVWK